MAFTEYPTKDGQRVAEILDATHQVRTAAASLAELLAQIGEQIQVLEHARELAKEEAGKSLKLIIGLP